MFRIFRVFFARMFRRGLSDKVIFYHRTKDMVKSSDPGNHLSKFVRKLIIYMFLPWSEKHISQKNKPNLARI